MSEPNKYLEHHTLHTTGKEKDKVRRITSHIYGQQDQNLQKVELEFDSSSSEESECEIEDFQSIEISESDSSSDTEDKSDDMRVKVQTQEGCLEERKWIDCIY